MTRRHCKPRRLLHDADTWVADSGGKGAKERACGKTIQSWLIINSLSDSGSMMIGYEGMLQLTESQIGLVQPFPAEFD